MAKTAEVDLPSDREIRVKRWFAAPPQLVFDAHMKPELMKRWLLGPPGWTMPGCEVDARVGGAYLNTWKSEESGESFSIGGTFTLIDEPNRVEMIERFEGSSSEVTTTFEPHDGGTLLTTTMKFADQAARDAAAATGMTDGMEFGYKRLDELAAEGAL